MRRIAAAALCFFAIHAAAIPKAPGVDDIEKFYKTRKSGSFLGEKGVTIAYSEFLSKKSKGSIVIATGYSENMHKYSEVAHDLVKAGYSVFLFDHRGQGFSGRLLPDVRKAHMDEFEYFVRDLHKFTQNVVALDGVQPRYLLAHSMGGLVSARLLELYPDDFHAAVLSAPMLEVDLHGLPEAPTRWLLDALSFAGLDNFYVSGPDDPARQEFSKNKVTSNELRFTRLTLELAKAEPQAGIWGLTARWLDQALNASRLTRDEAAKDKTPTLIYLAEDDDYVKPRGIQEFCQKAADCRVQGFDKARHEILMENDSIRAPALKAALNFFELNGGRKAGTL